MGPASMIQPMNKGTHLFTDFRRHRLAQLSLCIRPWLGCKKKKTCTFIVYSFPYKVLSPRFFMGYYFIIDTYIIELWYLFSEWIISLEINQHDPDLLLNRNLAINNSLLNSNLGFDVTRIFFWRGGLKNWQLSLRFYRSWGTGPSRLLAQAIMGRLILRVHEGFPLKV